MDDGGTRQDHFVKIRLHNTHPTQERKVFRDRKMQVSNFHLANYFPCYLREHRFRMQDAGALHRAAHKPTRSIVFPSKKRALHCNHISWLHFRLPFLLVNRKLGETTSSIGDGAAAACHSCNVQCIGYTHTDCICVYVCCDVVCALWMQSQATLVQFIN